MPKCGCCGSIGKGNKNSCGKSAKHPCTKTPTCQEVFAAISAAIEVPREQAATEWATDMPFTCAAAAVAEQTLQDGALWSVNCWMQNVTGSTIDNGRDSWGRATSWWNYLEQKGAVTGPCKCRFKDCDNKAQVGGHMWVRDLDPTFVLLVPICISHNKLGMDHFVPSKHNTYGVLRQIPARFRTIFTRDGAGTSGAAARAAAAAPILASKLLPKFAEAEAAVPKAKRKPKVGATAKPCQKQPRKKTAATHDC